MFKFFVVFTCVLLSPQCLSSPAEDSVVSVYTTLPTTAGTNPPLDVYHQIANNIAERITSPFFKILGYNVSTAAPTVVSPKHTENKIELSEEEDLTTKHEVKPIDNNIVKQRDVEELSTEGVTKPQKKPEKFTLYSSFASYLPARIQNNDTLKNEVDNDLDSLELDDVEMDDPGKPREGPFIYVLEFFGSIIQLLWGGFMNLFKPSDNSGSR